jgi:phosphomannomutase
MKLNQEIFREYDIRGVVDKDFDAEFAHTLGRSFASYLKKNGVKDSQAVSVGRDARVSGDKLYKALCEGLADSGVNVYQIGLVTSPMSYFSTYALDVVGGIMITGSHNPPEYNGFKISLGKATIFGEEIQKIKKIILDQDFLKPEKKGSIVEKDIFKLYLDKYGSAFKLPKPVKVVVDCGNGCAGVITRKLFDRMGVKCEILFEEPDGTFPNHHPDPTVEENLVDLRKHVLASGAIAGIGFDGDADRIGVIDHKGKMLFGDELLCLFARSVLKENPGTTIIGDVKCSDRLYDDIAKHGGVPLMYKTGHSLIKNKMKEVGSKFSGEMSGHIFFADRNYGYDDAVYAAARLIEILSQTGKTIPELLEGLPPAFSTPEIRIETTEEKKRSIVAAIKKKFGNGDFKVNEIDGIRISFDDGFALVRSSNTQPVIVCRFEAFTEARLKVIRSLVEDEVQKLL